MGVEGTLEYLSDLLISVKKKKKKPTQTVSLKIRMDCEGCARKVKHVLSGVKGFNPNSTYHFHILFIHILSQIIAPYVSNIIFIL